jgi:hypothetical protein
MGETAGASSSRVMSPGPSKSPAPQYPTAEEEKAALRRYHEAKLAVDRTQGTGIGYSDQSAPQASSSSSSKPVSYDSLYPSSSGSAARPTSPPSGPSEQPPPFDVSAPAPGPSQPSWMTEKEKLRRAYEAQDAAALARRTPPPPTFPTPSPPPPSSTPPSYAGPSTGAQILSEKEMLRRKYEAEERAANMSPPPPQQQPLGRSSSAAPSISSRTMPVPPTASGSGSMPQTAAAQLMTRFDDGDRLTRTGSQTMGASSSSSSSSISSPGPPPPLKPRPPMDYIKETQDEDARVSRIADSDLIPHTNGYGHDSYSPGVNGFGTSLPSGSSTSSNGIPNPGPPPPLPPKIRIE